MKEIFADIYNKVLNFFQSSKEEENSKETACNRLKLVLMQDRVHMDPFIMQKMREEMIEILNKYLEIDNDALDLNLAGEGDSVALMFNIPVIRAKSNEEIEEYEKALKEKLAQEAKEQEAEETEEEQNEETSETEDEENNQSEEYNEEETSEEESVEEEVQEPEEVKQEEKEETEEPVKKEKKSSKKSEG